MLLLPRGGGGGGGGISVSRDSSVYVNCHNSRPVDQPTMRVGDFFLCVPWHMVYTDAGRQRAEKVETIKIQASFIFLTVHSPPAGGGARSCMRHAGYVVWIM